METNRTTWRFATALVLGGAVALSGNGCTALKSPFANNQPVSEERTLEIAEEYLAAGQYESAERLFTDVLDANPDSARATTGLQAVADRRPSEESPPAESTSETLIANASGEDSAPVDKSTTSESASDISLVGAEGHETTTQTASGESSSTPFAEFLVANDVYDKEPATASMDAEEAVVAQGESTELFETADPNDPELQVDLGAAVVELLASERAPQQPVVEQATAESEEPSEPVEPTLAADTDVAGTEATTPAIEAESASEIPDWESLFAPSSSIADASQESPSADESIEWYEPLEATEPEEEPADELAASSGEEQLSTSDFAPAWADALEAESLAQGASPTVDEAAVAENVPTESALAGPSEVVPSATAFASGNEAADWLESAMSREAEEPATELPAVKSETMEVAAIEVADVGTTDPEVVGNGVVASSGDEERSPADQTSESDEEFFKPVAVPLQTGLELDPIGNRDDSSPHTPESDVARLLAAQAQLAFDGDDVEAWKTIDALLSSSDAATQSLTVVSLCELPEACHTSVVQRLRTVLVVENSDELQAAAALALGGLGSTAESAVPLLRNIVLTGGDQASDAAEVSLKCLGYEIVR